MPKIERVSIPADGTDILPKTRQKSAPPAEGRHEKFQFGTNPMKMTPFEKSRAALEVEERKMAAIKYIHGIQGRDGGQCYEDDRPRLTVPNNISRD
jgi:hypothetical protein